MAQHDYRIDNQPGAAFRADLNAALAAIVSQNSGATAPSPTYAYMFWADTTTGILKQRNANNTDWVSILNLADGRPVSPEGPPTTTGPITTSGLTINADRLAGRATAGSGAIEEIVCTPFARTLLDDANQSAALTTLGAPLNAVVQLASAYTVVVADRGKLFDCTGTFTIGLTSAATLGAGFTFAIRNSGTGVITIDPNASELIDGAATVTYAPGASSLVVCNGTGFKTVGLAGSAGSAAGGKLFTASGTYTKPAGLKWAKITVIGGGGGGAGGSGGRCCGGGGGGVAITVVRASDIGATEVVTVGAGGAGGIGNGGPGGTSSFGTLATATGGGGGSSYSAGNGGDGSSGHLTVGGGGGNVYTWDGYAYSGGAGGSTLYGGGASSTPYGGSSNPGRVCGGGGSGSGSGGNGGPGAPGIVMVEEFF